MAVGTILLFGLRVLMACPSTTQTPRINDRKTTTLVPKKKVKKRLDTEFSVIVNYNSKSLRGDLLSEYIGEKPRGEK